VAETTPHSAGGDLSSLEFLRLLAGDRTLRKRLEAGEHLRAVTPFHYPGRYGPVVVALAPAEGAPAAGAPPSVRISDNGDILKSLDEQGMDLTVDMILSKTVFHAVKEIEGAGVAGGLVFIDSDLDKVPADVWRFLQLTAELVGLRHSKYKDALVRLSRRQEGPDLMDWGGR
jgi:hypothetical protein